MTALELAEALINAADKYGDRPVFSGGGYEVVGWEAKNSTFNVPATQEPIFVLKT